MSKERFDRSKPHVNIGTIGGPSLEKTVLHTSIIEHLKRSREIVGECEKIVSVDYGDQEMRVLIETDDETAEKIKNGKHKEVSVGYNVQAQDNGLKPDFVIIDDPIADMTKEECEAWYKKVKELGLYALEYGMKKPKKATLVSSVDHDILAEAYGMGETRKAENKRKKALKQVLADDFRKKKGF